MAISIIGGSSGVKQDVDDSHDAGRVSLYPLDPGSLGAYGLALNSGIMAAGLGASSEIFQFRWTHATYKAVIQRVTFGAIVGGTGFTAGAFDFRLVPARTWTAAGSGGTAATLTGNNCKLRTSFATTNLNDARVSSTAALTAGTKTLDAQGIANLGGAVGTGAAQSMVQAGSYFIDPTHYPLVLAQNDGFVILATVPATGVWSFGVGVQWVERSAF